MATKVVMDSAAAANAVEALGRLAEGVRRGGILADLAWTRLTRWRETLARVFENRDTLGRLSEIESVQVRFGAGLRNGCLVPGGVGDERARLGGQGGDAVVVARRTNRCGWNSPAARSVWNSRGRTSAW